MNVSKKSDDILSVSFMIVQPFNSLRGKSNYKHRRLIVGVWGLCVGVCVGGVWGCVCVYVRLSFYGFRCASTYGPETLHRRRKLVPETHDYFRSDPVKGQSSSRGHCLRNLNNYQIWPEKSQTKALCIAGIKGHGGVIQDNRHFLFRNALWPINLVEELMIKV